LPVHESFTTEQTFHPFNVNIPLENTESMLEM